MLKENIVSNQEAGDYYRKTLGEFLAEQMDLLNFIHWNIDGRICNGEGMKQTN